MKVRKFKYQYRVEMVPNTTHYRERTAARAEAKIWCQKHFGIVSYATDLTKLRWSIPGGRVGAYAYFINEEDVSHFLLGFRPGTNE